MNHLGEEFNFDPKERQICCGPHVLNLVVKAMIYGTESDNLDDLLDQDESIHNESTNTTITSAYLKRYRKEGPLGKLHNHGVCFNHSSQLVALFAEAQVRHHPYLYRKHALTC